MAEWENPRYIDDGYSPDLEATKLDLYRLLNQFLASKKLSELCCDDLELSHAMYTLDPFFEVEATRILLSSAVIARVMDDKYNERDKYNTNSGFLIKNINEPKVVVDLNLREACNKIIHADTIRYDVEVDVKGKTQRYFNPYIYYYGTHNKKRWKATLSVVDYVKRYTDNIV